MALLYFFNDPFLVSIGNVDQRALYIGRAKHCWVELYNGTMR